MNGPSPEIVRSSLLIREADAANNLLTYGTHSLRAAMYETTMRDPVLTMLSIGVEKLLKISFGAFEFDSRGLWPTRSEMRKYSHSVVALNEVVWEKMRANVEKCAYPHQLRTRMEVVDTDPIWPLVLATLGRYADSGRFYYLDALGGSEQVDDSPEVYWRKVEMATKALSPATEKLFADFAAGRITNATFRGEFNDRIAASIDHWRDAVVTVLARGAAGELGRVAGLELGLQPTQTENCF